jgi:hypothetical protein
LAYQYEKGWIRTDRGEFIDKGNQVVDVCHPDFNGKGAKGDGVTDDTQAITDAQAFLDSLGGGILFFPPGTYLYSDDVIPTASVTWRGCGRGVSTLKRTGSGSQVFNPANVNDVLVEGLTFDFNGSTSEFTGAIRASGCKRVVIRNCSVTDSNPTTTTISLGTGDGTTKTFTVTKSSDGDYMVLPGTVTLTAGSVSLRDGWLGQWVDADAGPATYMSADVTPCVVTVTTTGNFANNDVITIDRVRYRFVTVLAAANDIQIGASASATLASFVHALNGTGVAGTDYFTGTTNQSTLGTASSTSTVLTLISKHQQDIRIIESVDSGGNFSVASTTSRIEYGDSNGNWAATVVFATAPTNGTDVSLTYGYCDQRQPILLLNVSEVLVEGNFLECGGRIKIGRPGNKCIIRDNILYGVNDNGITVVDEIGQCSTDLTISGNMVFFPATTGIFAGGDLGNVPPSDTTSHNNTRIIGNTIVGGPMNGILVSFTAGGTRNLQIHDNHIRRIGATHFGTNRSAIYYQKEASDTDTTNDNVACSIVGNTIEGEFRQRYIGAGGRNIDISGNLINGMSGRGTAIDLSSVRRANIHHNIAEGVSLFLEGDGGNYEDVTIESNQWNAEATTSDRGHIFFDDPVTLSRLAVVRNKARGGQDGSGQRYVLELNVIQDVDLEFVGNDWSAESTMRDIDLDNGATLASTSRYYGNRGTGTYGSMGLALLAGSGTWNPGNLVDGAGETSPSFTVTGAALGDFARAAAPYDLQGVTCNAYVDAANSVKVRLQNETGGAVDLASGTWKIRVEKQ